MNRPRVEGLRDISFADSPCKVYKSMDDLKKGIVDKVIYTQPTPSTGTIVLGNKHKRKNKDVCTN